MEKDTSRFCYDPYPTVSKQNTNSLKGEASKRTKEKKSCCCFSKRSRRRSKAFLAGLATNLGICVLLFGYTLIGSVIFLAIEGGSSYQHQILATTSLSTNINNQKKNSNHSTDMKARNDEARAKTVENIWDITVSLNILYRDNWTRLAAEEISRFQEEILRSITEEMALQQPLQVSNHRHKHQPDPYKWSFARAFLYSLTVLTTIEYINQLPQIYNMWMHYSSQSWPIAEDIMSGVRRLKCQFADLERETLHALNYDVSVCFDEEHLQRLYKQVDQYKNGFLLCARFEYGSIDLEQFVEAMFEGDLVQHLYEISDFLPNYLVQRYNIGITPVVSDVEEEDGL